MLDGSTGHRADRQLDDRDVIEELRWGVHDVQRGAALRVRGRELPGRECRGWEELSASLDCDGHGGEFDHG